MGYTRGEKWDDCKILETLKELVDKHNLKVMPSFSQLDSYFGNTKLTNAISKRKGVKYYASQLGLEIAYCESVFGKKFEEYCICEIEEKLKLPCFETKTRHPYDILVNRTVKVDVKVGKKYNSCSNSSYYTFNLEKKEQTCDIFVCYCVDENEEIQKTLIIPSFVLSGKTQLSVGIQKSVYHKYADAWHLIVKYDEFIKNTILN